MSQIGNFMTKKPDSGRVDCHPHNKGNPYDDITRMGWLRAQSGTEIYIDYETGEAKIFCWRGNINDRYNIQYIGNTLNEAIDKAIYEWVTPPIIVETIK
jgi:hypothetical protein